MKAYMIIIGIASIIMGFAAIVLGSHALNYLQILMPSKSIELSGVFFVILGFAMVYSSIKFSGDSSGER